MIPNLDINKNQKGINTDMTPTTIRKNGRKEQQKVKGKKTKTKQQLPGNRLKGNQAYWCNFLN